VTPDALANRRFLYSRVLSSRGWDVNNKNNTPSLDLSFVYGADTLEKLREYDIDPYAQIESESTGDTTIRAVTSLFRGRRRLEGLARMLSEGYDPYNSVEAIDKSQ
jgi:hypothetical protein